MAFKEPRQQKLSFYILCKFLVPVSTADNGIYSHMESPRLWGVDYGFGGFCKGSWEENRSSFWVS